MNSRPTDDDVKWARGFVERVKATQPTEEQIVEALAHERATVRYEGWWKGFHEPNAANALRMADVFPPTITGENLEGVERIKIGGRTFVPEEPKEWTRGYEHGLKHGWAEALAAAARACEAVDPIRCGVGMLPGGNIQEWTAINPNAAKCAAAVRALAVGQPMADAPPASDTAFLREDPGDVEYVRPEIEKLLQPILERSEMGGTPHEWRALCEAFDAGYAYARRPMQAVVTLSESEAADARPTAAAPPNDK